MLILLMFKGLEKRIELILAGLGFFISHMGGVGHGLAKRFFCSFSLFVIAHLLFPRRKLIVSSIKNHRVLRLILWNMKLVDYILLSARFYFLYNFIKMKRRKGKKNKNVKTMILLIEYLKSSIFSEATSLD
jgi:hypothetical protein